MSNIMDVNFNGITAEMLKIISDYDEVSGFHYVNQALRAHTISVRTASAPAEDRRRISLSNQKKTSRV